MNIEQAREARAQMIASVRAEFRDGAPRFTDDQVWQAWRRTSREMAELVASGKPLARFVPRNPQGNVMISPPMVAMGLLQDVIEGRL